MTNMNPEALKAARLAVHSLICFDELGGLECTHAVVAGGASDIQAHAALEAALPYLRAEFALEVLDAYRSQLKDPRSASDPETIERVESWLYERSERARLSTPDPENLFYTPAPPKIADTPEAATSGTGPTTLHLYAQPPTISNPYYAGVDKEPEVDSDGPVS